MAQFDGIKVNDITQLLLFLAKITCGMEMEEFCG